MTRAHAMSIVVLACTFGLMPGQGQAQGRGPASQGLQEQAKVADSPEARARKMAELESWLRRLPGQFSVKLTYASMPFISPCGIPPVPRCIMADFYAPQSIIPEFEGLADCADVGAGPGVSCVFNITSHAGELIPQVPRVILYGLDPDDPDIRLMEVDNLTGSAKVARGSLANDTVAFQMECTKSGDQRIDRASCTRVIRVRASPDGKRVQMTITADEILRAGQRTATPLSGGGTQIDLLRAAEPSE